MTAMISNKELLNKLNQLDQQLKELEGALSKTINEEAKKIREEQLNKISELEKFVQLQLGYITKLSKIS